MSTFVVKVGGDILRRPVLESVCADVATLLEGGHRVVLVHGGGPQATALQKQLGQEPSIVGGRRITDSDALDVIKMAVGGALNIDLCSAGIEPMPRSPTTVPAREVGEADL